MRRGDRLAAVHRENDVPSLQLELRVLGDADHEYPVRGAEVLTQIGVKRRHLEVGQRRAIQHRAQAAELAFGVIAHPKGHAPVAVRAEIAKGETSPARTTLEGDIRLVRGYYRCGFPGVPPAELDGYGVVGLQAGNQLDEPETGQRLSLSTATGRATGEDRAPIYLGDDVTRLDAGSGGRAVRR